VDFRKQWPKGHVVLPVVHLHHNPIATEVMDSVEVVRSAGADGCWLIAYGTPVDTVLDLQDKVRDSKFWVGLNILGYSPHHLRGLLGVAHHGIWADNADIREDRPEQRIAQKFKEALEAYPNVMYFGGVAFKGQYQPKDLEANAKLATQYMHVVCTSGPGTGQAASVMKIQRMKAALGDFPLAIASGITPDNIEDYLPFSDAYLVATGISNQQDELQYDLTKALVDKVRAWDAKETMLQQA